MAFTLNAAANPVSPSGQLASANTYIDPYTYDLVHRPDQISKLHLQRGKGKLFSFCAYSGSLQPFASDQVRWQELGDLHQASVAATRVADEITTPSAHNLRVGETIILSDGLAQNQATVTAITSSTVFTAKNKKNAAWAIGVSGITLFKFSNSWGKGEGNFTTGREDNPVNKVNYPQIIKDIYIENESDMAHLTWIETPQYAGGEGWYNVELARTEDAYDNLIELTHLLHERAESGSDSVVAGYERGMKGIVQQIEEGGHTGTETITTTDELSDIVFRIKQEGGSTDYAWWKDHAQSAAFRKMLANENAYFTGGTNYGMFNNNPEMALHLGFKSVFVDGVSFHSQDLRVFDEPQLLGAAAISNTSIQSLMMPMGDKKVLENGQEYDQPFLTIRYREMGGINRFKKTKFFGGVFGTPHKIDTMEMHIETEMTNQVIGANQFFVFKRS
ncbi:hypothetical protein [Thalassobellus suaedae]|uniref:Uncharacterized protein n=1 Tax=Thalassobellus suaedae TaxID=3074124 RepID=A0ABY9XW57_9FLAO|nr:hypothetical protein RHP51_04915 [Flavobacteriaceae bacterium HL-DH14]